MGHPASCTPPSPFCGRSPTSSSPCSSPSEKQNEASSGVLSSLEVTAQLGHPPGDTPHRLRKALYLWAPLRCQGLLGEKERSHSLDEQHSCSPTVLCLGKQLPFFLLCGLSNTRARTKALACHGGDMKAVIACKTLTCVGIPVQALGSDSQLCPLPSSRSCSPWGRRGVTSHTRAVRW